MEIHRPPNERVIDDVWVGLSEDEDGKNGICAMFSPGIGGTPMLTANATLLEFFKRQAPDLAKISGGRIKIYRFVRAECVYDSEAK